MARFIVIASNYGDLASINVEALSESEAIWRAALLFKERTSRGEGWGPCVESEPANYVGEGVDSHHRGFDSRWERNAANGGMTLMFDRCPI